MPAETTNSVDLWTCFHDGIIEGLRSDLMARTLTFVIDSPFHWEFHSLPAGTRFELIGENVRAVEVFDFEPWPGAVEPPLETPWEEAQAQRRRDWDKARLISSNWADFASQVGTDEEYIVMSAELTNETSQSVLRLGVNSYPSSNYRELQIRAEKFSFLVGKLELSLDELQKFGDAYWDDFSRRSQERQSANDFVKR